MQPTYELTGGRGHYVVGVKVPGEFLFAFLSFFAFLFSLSDLAGFFLVCFFLFWPFAMIRFLPSFEVILADGANTPTL